MGVKGLTGLLQKLAPDAVRRKHISDYRGKTLAVDVSCFLNRFIYGLDPHPARVQRGVYKLCMYLKLHGIKPIFVFDGPGRIIEKQRETRRREALKEKVERSFRFEKERKARLRGLRGSAQLLQTYSPDKVSSILDDIRLQSDAATGRVSSATLPLSDGNLPVKHENGKATQTDRHHVAQSAPVKEVLLKPPDWDTLDARMLADSDEASDHDDQAWIAPATTEDGQTDLGTHLRRSSSFYEAGAPLLDAETVDGLDIIQDLTDNDASPLSNETLQILRTGTSVTAIIAPSDMMQIAKEDPSDPDFDGMVRKKVHEALEKFVESVEARAQGNSESAPEITTQRQRELNALEQKLVQEIKETSRINAQRHASQSEPVLEVSQPPQTPSASRPEEHEKEADAAPAILMASTAAAATEEKPVEQDPTTKDESADFPSTPELTQDGFAVDATESADPIAIAEPVDMTDMASMVDPADTADISNTVIMTDMADITASTVDAAETVETVSDDADAADTADTMPVASDDTRTSDEETMVEGSAAETEERDMRSMIYNVLSAHQSIFTSLERRTLRVTRPLVLSCQYLLQAMGEPVIEAFDAEAESVCAHLTTLGVADASVSEDTDTAVFGNGLLLRQVAVGGEKDILEIDPLRAHSALGMSRDAFRDFCILCGTDFSGTIEGIGPLRAVQLVQYYGSIEAIMANVRDKYKPRPDFVYDQARRVFDRIPHVSLDPTVYECKPEIQPLLSELLLKYGIDENEAKNEILSDTGIGGTPGTGLGSSLGTGSFGADPFRASVIDIPGSTSSS
ncbi:Elongation of fatty acids protein 2 [Mortierella alpina]|uniref:Elongation of fatty acids protein 2 n=1 Tax=Mortierella alpina TaxID=64518 RepID=A0A9P6J055_MORAP|nr:Elongation of fatty acids protein 2 [Mortierella alpina]